MIINQEFKNLYKNIINELISSNGLTTLCTISFNNGSADFCNNCQFDMLSKTSANIYNGMGPVPFAENTICPVCMGAGIKHNNNKTKSLYLAVILDSKYFFNLDTKVINVPIGSMQTISRIETMFDLRNANSIYINQTPNILYERIDEPNLSGLGDLEYIVTTWRRQ